MNTSAPDESPGLQPRDRRQHERLNVRIPIIATRDNRQGRLLAWNIGLGGICCRSESRYAPATSLTLSFDVSGGRGDREIEPLALEAVVLRCEPQPRELGMWDVALYFPHTDPRSRQRLARYIESLRTV